jgi:hypothetical protein
METKVRNPKTNKLINVDGPTFNKLIEEFHYTREELLAHELTPLPAELPQDIIYNILLQSNIYQIKNLCFVNKYNYKICSSLAFWEYIFERDGYPLFEVHTKAEDWLDEYFKMMELDKLVTGVIKNINKHKHTRLETRDSKQQIRWINQFISNLNYNYMIPITISMIKKNSYTVASPFNNIKVDKKELKLILLKTFYQYPRVQLTTLRGDNIIPRYKDKNEPISKRVKSNKRNIKK